MAGKQELYEKHAELFHYTNLKGVEGILASQNLRATHYKFLNDSSELKLMRPELTERLYPFLRDEAVKIFRQGGFKMKEKIRKGGGPLKVARDQAKHLEDAIYKTAFENTITGPALATPYITSFCAHTSDKAYEQKNGLLSQWRGYGQDGYAIVFDAKKLIDLYKIEGNQYYYATAVIGDVVYQHDEREFEEEFGEAIKKIENVFRNFMEIGEWEVGEIFGDIISMYTRLKHCGFYEEREVRAISCPVTKEIEDVHKLVNPDYVRPKKKMKEIFKRNDGGMYIETLGLGNKKVLPIKRIIVGPQKNINVAKRKLEKLVGNRRIKVHCSETPLVWHGS